MKSETAGIQKKIFFSAQFNKRKTFGTITGNFKTAMYVTFGVK